MVLDSCIAPASALPRSEWVTKACRQPQRTFRPHSRSVSGRTCLVKDIKVEVGQIFSIEESELTSAACSTQSKAK